MLELGKRYLVKKKDKDYILEWECIEVAKNAVKIINKINEYRSNYELFASSARINDPIWILNSRIDYIGQSDFQIIEELKTN